MFPKSQVPKGCSLLPTMFCASSNPENRTCRAQRIQRDLGSSKDSENDGLHGYTFPVFLREDNEVYVQENSIALLEGPIQLSLGNMINLHVLRNICLNEQLFKKHETYRHITHFLAGNG